MVRSWRAPTACAFIFCAALWAVAAAAQMTVPGAKRKADEPAPAGAALASLEAIAQAEAAAKVRLAAIEAGGDAPVDAPPGTPPFEIITRLALARGLVSVYDKQRNSLERLERAREARAAAERAIESWRGFEQPPPRPVLLIDSLRDELDSANHALVSAGETSAFFERLDAEFSPRLKTAQAEARLAVEALDRGRGTPAFARLEWKRNLLSLKADVDSATQTLLQLGLRAAQAEHDAAVARRDFARHKLIDVGNEIVMSSADLEKITAEIETRRLTAERGLERATAYEASTSVALTASDAALTAERAAVGTAKTPRLLELERDAVAAREVATTASQRVFLLREHLTVLQGERSIWEARASALSLRDPVQARTAYERLSEGIVGLRASRQYLAQMLATTSGRMQDEEARQRSKLGTADAADRRLIETLRERESDLRKAIDGMAPLERVIAHFRTDFQGRRDITLVERAKDASAVVWLAVRQFWNYELFTIDDTLEAADGRKVPVSRSVTIGKSFGAVLIVVLGYQLSSLVLGWFERRSVAKRRASPQAAALVRKWILFVLTAILAILALLTASIPLTAFAFLGGALAIAAGFGLQTLLKNLVSGVMLLVERPMRLGDLVEVDGIRGRVTEIGIRASTIRSGDGTDSMVPNSRFLEGSMTNWTYSAPTARQTITLGVAYGSPLRKVHEILKDVMERHGLVRDDPKPQVYLDGYGDSAINFALTYWVQMTEDVDSRRVRSDVLHMIDRAFEEAGISIPFPQREVRMTADTPLPVAIVGSASGRVAA